MNVELDRLVSLWQDKLERFMNNPDIAKGMDANTAMGVQYGRTIALKQCLDDLKQIIESANMNVQT